MTPDSFDTQLTRLIDTYGKNAYPQPRANLIFQEFKDQPDWLFERVVTTLIGERRTPPMLSEFREEMAKLRERRVAHEKEQHRRENAALFELDGLAIHLYNATMSKDPEERKTVQFWINIKGLEWVDAKIEKGKIEYQKQQAELARRGA